MKEREGGREGERERGETNMLVSTDFAETERESEREREGGRERREREGDRR